MYPLLFASSLAFAAPQTFDMNGAGITIVLPQSWEMAHWSDWDWSGKGKDGVNLKIWTTPYQVDVTEDNARAWAEMYAGQMKKEGFTDIVVDKAIVDTIAGRPAARVQLTMHSSSGGAQAAIYHGVAFTGPAQVVHMYTLSLGRLSDRAERDLEDLLAQMTIQKGPLKLPGQEVSSAAGFAATLPQGWRAPLPDELEAVAAITATAGEPDLPAERCWSALRPPAVGDPDVIFACSGSLYLGPVDGYSFSSVEPEVRERFFGRVTPPISPAEAVTVGDRTGFYFRPSQGKEPVRLVVAPYGAGQIMMVWALGKHLEATALDADLQALLPTVKFTGDNGGKPQIGFDRWVAYYLTSRFFSPIVLGPLIGLLTVLGLIVRAVTRKKPQQEI